MAIFLEITFVLICIIFLNRKLWAKEPDKRSQLYERLSRDRCIPMGSVLTDEEAAKVVAQLKLYESQSKTAPITLFINSPGGTLSAGIAILDAMKSVHAEIHTCCAGQAHSLAAIILAAGSPGHRVAVENSVISFTEISSGGVITPEKTTEYARLTATLVDKTAHLTHVNPEKLKELFASNAPLTANDAVKLGIVDEVIPSRAAGQ